MSPKQKSILLDKVVDLLERADTLQQNAINNGEYHARIQDLIEDLVSEIAEVDNQVV